MVLNGKNGIVPFFCAVIHHIAIFYKGECKLGIVREHLGMIKDQFGLGLCDTFFTNGLIVDRFIVLRISTAKKQEKNERK